MVSKPMALRIVARGDGGQVVLRAVAELVDDYLFRMGACPTGRLIGDEEAFVYFSIPGQVCDLDLDDLARCAGVSPTDLTVNDDSQAELDEPPGESGSSPKRRPRRFDVWGVPLSTGGFGYLQSLERHEEFLDLVRVFDVITPKLLPLKKVLGSRIMFPPVFTLVSPTTVRKNQLQFLGNSEVQYTRPTFRHANLAMVYPDQYDSDWTLWTFTGGYQPIGRLSQEQRELEPLMMWPVQDLRKRIERRLGPRDVLERIDEPAVPTQS